MTKNTNDSSISESTSLVHEQTNHSGFIGILPFDIVLTIFSYLDQQDSITCMGVSRDWFNKIPFYTRSSWKTIHLDKEGPINLRYKTESEEKRWEQCIGKHVKYIIFDTFAEQDLYQMMRKLFQLGCDSTQSITFLDCQGEDQNIFIPLLLQLGSNVLTKLTFKNHHYNVALFDILCLCPQLTHLVYQPTFDAWKNGNISKQEPTITMNHKQQYEAIRENFQATTNFSQLIYLHIDAAMDYQKRLKPILQKCPNLQYFLGNEALTYEMQIKDASFAGCACVGLEDICSWCPNLIYFMGHGSFEEEPESNKLNHVQIVKNKDNDDDRLQQQLNVGFYHLVASEDDDKNNYLPNFIKKHRNTLAYLSITRYNFHEDGNDWSPCFRYLMMPQLTTLTLDNIRINHNELFSMIRRCPAMRVFTWKSYRDFDLTNPVQIRTLDTLPSIREFNLTGVSLTQDTFSIILSRLPGLKKLSLSHSLATTIKNPFNTFSRCQQLTDLTFNSVQCLPDIEEGNSTALLLPATFITPIRRGALFPSVQNVKLTNMRYITYRMLDILCLHMPVLQRLEVSMDNVEQYLLFDSLVQTKSLDGPLNVFTTLAKTGTIQEFTVDSFYHLKALCDALQSTLDKLPRLKRLGMQLPALYRNHFQSQRENAIIAAIGESGLLELLLGEDRFDSPFVTIDFYSVVTKGAPANELIKQLLIQKQISSNRYTMSFKQKDSGFVVTNFFKTDVTLKYIKGAL